MANNRRTFSQQAQAAIDSTRAPIRDARTAIGNARTLWKDLESNSLAGVLTNQMGNAFGGRFGKFVKDNPRLAQAGVFMGLPLLFSTIPWALGRATTEEGKDDDEDQRPDFWTYALPFMALGGGAWWLADNIHLGDVVNNALGINVRQAIGNAENSVNEVEKTVNYADDLNKKYGPTVDNVEEGLELADYAWQKAKRGARGYGRAFKEGCDAIADGARWYGRAYKKGLDTIANSF